jgi:hypothetical protein
VREFARDGRGLIWAAIANERYRAPYGLLASDGTWKLEPQFLYPNPLVNDAAVVYTQSAGARVSGVIDGNGQFVIPLQPRWLIGWDERWGVIRESDRSEKQALIDTAGNIIGGRYFDKIELPRRGGDIALVLSNGQWLGMDRAGNLVPNPNNGRVTASCPNGVRIVSIDGRARVTDANGNPTTAYLFEPLIQQPSCDKPFTVKLDGKWGFVGLDGRLLFDPPPFENVYGFDGNYAFVQQNRKWGVIDTMGRFVLAPKIDAIHERRAGLLRVTVEGRNACITPAGEEREEPPVRYVPDPKHLDCGYGMRLIERDGRWGIVEADGREIIAPSYRALGCFSQGVVWAPIDQERRWCALGPDALRRERPPCRATHYSTIISHAYPEKFNEDPFESSVLWTRAYLEFAAGKRSLPPGWVPDGVRGGNPANIIR